MVSICHTPLPLPADVICEQPLKYYTCILSHCTSFKFNNKLHNVPNVAEPSIPAMLKCQMHPMASPSSYWCWPRGFSPDHIITLRLYGSPPIIWAHLAFGSRFCSIGGNKASSSRPQKCSQGLNWNSKFLNDTHDKQTEGQITLKGCDDIVLWNVR